MRSCPVALGPRSPRDQPKRGGNVDALRLDVIKGLADEQRDRTISLSTRPRRRVRHVATLRRTLIRLFTTCEESEMLS
jgi:hypothetical protein